MAGLFIGKKVNKLTIYFIYLLFPAFLLSGHLQYGLDAKRESCESINRFQIFGERCSGTNFLHCLLLENVDENLKFDSPNWYEYGWKHFPLWITVPFENNPRESLLKNYNFEDSEKHLFIVIFRDPYDWIRSLHREPHHARASMLRKPLNVFITIPWDSQVPLDRNPLTGGNFESVLALRTARIINMLLIKEKVKNIYFVRYETVRDYPREVINEISELFDIPFKPDFTPIGSYKGKKYHPFVKSRYLDLSQEEVNLINSQLDEVTENAIGYQIIPIAEDVNRR